MQTETVSEEKAVMVTTDSGDALRENARKFYGQMQTSWYLFAKTLGEIKDNYKELSYEEKSFKDFCAVEYPSFNINTIYKMVRIMEAWGKDIENKMEKEPDFKLPAYESCYQLITVEDKIGKPDYTKLRKAVMTGKLSFYELRSKLKTVMDKAKAAASKDVDTDVDSLEEELSTDIEETVDLGTEPEEAVKNLCTGITARLEWLSENIPFLTQTIESNPECAGEEVVELAQELEQMVDKANGLLTMIEEITN